MYLNKEELEYILECVGFTQSKLGDNDWQQGVKERIENEILFLESGKKHILYK